MFQEALEGGKVKDKPFYFRYLILFQCEGGLFEIKFTLNILFYLKVTEDFLN